MIIGTAYPFKHLNIKFGLLVILDYTLLNIRYFKDLIRGLCPAVLYHILHQLIVADTKIF